VCACSGTVNVLYCTVCTAFLIDGARPRTCRSLCIPASALVLPPVPPRPAVVSSFSRRFPSNNIPGRILHSKFNSIRALLNIHNSLHSAKPCEILFAQWRACRLRLFRRLLHRRAVTTGLACSQTRTSRLDPFLGLRVVSLQLSVDLFVPVLNRPRVRRPLPGLPQLLTPDLHGSQRCRFLTAFLFVTLWYCCCCCYNRVGCVYSSSHHCRRKLPCTGLVCQLVCAPSAGRSVILRTKLNSASASRQRVNSGTWREDTTSTLGIFW
jgi:hypothetical protein